MEKTKFIRVAVEERLPKKDKGVLFFNENTNSCAFLRNSTDFIIHYEFTHWLEEIPDREDEMLQMLEKAKQELYNSDNLFAAKIREFLESVKQTK